MINHLEIRYSLFDILQPFLSFKIPKKYQRGGDHDNNGQWIAERPFQLRHKTEVHTIDARDKCRGHEHNSNYCENFYHFVLLDIHQAQECILQVFQSFKAELCMLQNRSNIFYDDPEAFRLRFCDVPAFHE